MGLWIWKWVRHESAVLLVNSSTRALRVESGNSYESILEPKTKTLNIKRRHQPDYGGTATDLRSKCNQKGHSVMLRCAPRVYLIWSHYPWRCLCFGFWQITITCLWRRIRRQFSHILRTELRTFINFLHFRSWLDLQKRSILPPNRS